MRRTRFDTRLIQILSAMAALAIMVGVAAIGVNRYLVRAQAELVQTNLPAIELASRIGVAVEVVGSLEEAFGRADTRAGLMRSLRRSTDSGPDRGRLAEARTDAPGFCPRLATA